MQHNTVPDSADNVNVKQSNCTVKTVKKIDISFYVVADNVSVTCI